MQALPPACLKNAFGGRFKFPCVSLFTLDFRRVGGRRKEETRIYFFAFIFPLAENEKNVGWAQTFREIFTNVCFLRVVCLVCYPPWFGAKMRTNFGILSICK